MEYDPLRSRPSIPISWVSLAGVAREALFCPGLEAEASCFESAGWRVSGVPEPQPQ